MRSLCIFIVLSFTIPSFQAQIIPSSCEAADSIVEVYFVDATQLALRKIFEQNLPEKDSVEVPTVHVDSILNAMIAVYNVDIPERDSVIDIFKIHARHIIPMGDIRALIDTNFSMTTPVLDSLMTKYGITAYYQTIGNNDYALFKVDEKYNVDPLINVIKSVTGVLNATAGHYFLADYDIKSSINNDYVELIYSFGWGDCMSGCMYRRYWKFKVDYNCSVEFMKSYGDINPPIPPTLSIEKIDGLKDISIFPNPASNQFNFSINDNSSFVALTIYDASGVKIKNLKYDNQENGEFNQSVDISKLKSGLYCCVISNGEKQVIKKFIKR